MHTVDCRIEAQNSCDARPEEEDSVEEIPRELLFVTSNPSLDTVVLARNVAGGRVKRLVWKNSITLYLETNHQNWRERVRELHDTRCSHKGGEKRDLWNSSTNDEGKDPVDRHEGDPNPLSGLRLENGKLEQVSANIVVDDLDADVTVETSGDNSSNQLKNVANSLPAIGIDSLVGRVVDVLPLQPVADSTVYKVS